MFTGIISNLGRLKNKQENVFSFKTDLDFCKSLDNGTSIAINGVCLTVLQKPIADIFSVEVMPETLKKTMLSKLEINDVVNLELPLTLKDFISGHLVQGHVDGVASVENIIDDKNSKILTVKIPEESSRFIVEKGSICLNGVSLTIIEVGKDFIKVGIIPYTFENTSFKYVKIGDLINIEIDIFAKYAEKILRPDFIGTQDDR